MSEAPPNADDPQFEALLAAAIDTLEQHGDAALDRLLAEQPGLAAAVRRSLDQLRVAGVLSPPPPTGAFPTRLGDFRLLERLGGGGMGVVFLAEQESLKRRVAVKLVRPELLMSETARERFRREIETVSQLQHPGIVPILAVGSDGGIPWFAMEYVQGQTLEQVLTAVGSRAPASLNARDIASAFGEPRVGSGTGSGTPGSRITEGSWWEACVRIVHAVAQTMAYVHARGIVHRDLKPSNVVLTPDGRTLLLDFGLAQTEHAARLTRTGAEVGSPAYMAPEQLRGETVDARSDIYALGVSLWQLLALQMPFSGASSEALRQSILAGQRRALRALNPALPRELEIVVHTAMELAPSRRYRSMDDLAQDLAAVLARRPIAARPLGVHLRLLRWCQRHRAATAAIAVAALLLPAFPLVLLVQQHAYAAELELALQETRAANQEIGRARAIAESDYQEARSAIGHMLVDVAYDELSHVPATVPLRSELLRDAIAHYDRMANRHPDDLPTRLDRARARRHLASIWRDLGRVDDARKLLAAAITDLAGQPESVEALLERAFAGLVLAYLAYDARQWPVALLELDAAAVAANRALQLDPGHLRTRLAAIQLDNLRGLTHGQLGEPTERERHLRAAWSAVQAAAAAHPGDAALRDAHVLQLLNLGDALLTERPAEALPLLQEALTRARTLLRDHATPRHRARLAACANKLGLWHLQQKDLVAAEPLLLEALPLRQELAREHHDTPEPQSELAAALFNLGLLRQAQRRHPEALDYADQAWTQLQRALQLAPDDRRRDEPKAQILTLRCNAYQRLRRIDDLVQAAELLAAIPDSPRRPLQGAHHLLVASQLVRQDQGRAADARQTTAAALEQRALDLLAAAAARGLKDPRLLDGPTFATVAGRSEFAEVRRRIETNASRR